MFARWSSFYFDKLQYHFSLIPKDRRDFSSLGSFLLLFWIESSSQITRLCGVLLCVAAQLDFDKIPLFEIEEDLHDGEEEIVCSAPSIITVSSSSSRFMSFSMWSTFAKLCGFKNDASLMSSWASVFRNWISQLIFWRSSKRIKIQWY